MRWFFWFLHMVKVDPIYIVRKLACTLRMFRLFFSVSLDLFRKNVRVPQVWNRQTFLHTHKSLLHSSSIWQSGEVQQFKSSILGRKKGKWKTTTMQKCLWWSGLGSITHRKSSKYANLRVTFFPYLLKTGQRFLVLYHHGNKMYHS